MGLLDKFKKRNVTEEAQLANKQDSTLDERIVTLVERSEQWYKYFHERNQEIREELSKDGEYPYSWESESLAFHETITYMEDDILITPQMIDLCCNYFVRFLDSGDVFDEINFLIQKSYEQGHNDFRVNAAEMPQINGIIGAYLQGTPKNPLKLSINGELTDGACDHSEHCHFFVDAYDSNSDFGIGRKATEVSFFSPSLELLIKAAEDVEESCSFYLMENGSYIDILETLEKGMRYTRDYIVATVENHFNLEAPLALFNAQTYEEQIETLMKMFSFVEDSLTFPAKFDSLGDGPETRLQSECVRMVFNSMAQTFKEYKLTPKHIAGFIKRVTSCKSYEFTDHKGDEHTFYTDHAQTHVPILIQAAYATGYNKFTLNTHKNPSLRPYACTGINGAEGRPLKITINGPLEERAFDGAHNCEITLNGELIPSQVDLGYVSECSFTHSLGSTLKRLHDRPGHGNTYHLLKSDGTSQQVAFR